jgi:CRP-like cAMP-binding protein
LLTQTQLAPPSTLQSANAILSGLSLADKALLAPHLQLVDLPREQRLERRGRRSEYVYFLEHGVACALGDEKAGHGVEVGMIGREGFIGVAAVMGAGPCAHDVQMLAAGAARRAPAAALHKAMDESATLRKAVLGYVYQLLLQAMREAQINARATLEARLARWLLMMHDRVDGDELHLTHDRLAGMLGVRRAGVSVAAKKLERAGVILLHRGAIILTDRKRLEDSCIGVYGPPDGQAAKSTV